MSSNPPAPIPPLPLEDFEKGWKTQLLLDPVPFARFEQQAKDTNAFNILQAPEVDAKDLAKNHDQEIKDAKRSVREATAAIDAGKLQTGRRICARILREEMRTFGTSRAQNEDQMSLRMIIFQVARVYAKMSAALRLTNINTLLIRAVVSTLAGNAKADETLLTLTQDLVGYLLTRTTSISWCLKVSFEIMEHASLLSPEAAYRVQVISRRYLAERYAYFGELPSASFNLDVVARRYFEDLDFSTMTKCDLRAGHAYGIKLSLDGKIEEATRAFLHMIDARAFLYGETHNECNEFMPDLIKEYCEACQSVGKRDDLWNLIYDHLPKDLVDYCLENDMVDEAEAIAREFYTRFEKTDAKSSNNLFWPWFEIDTQTVQRYLASYKTPEKFTFWEDSRMYTMKWRKVQLMPIVMDAESLADVLPMPADYHTWEKEELDYPKVPKKLQYSIEESGKQFIDIAIPFLGYGQFQAWNKDSKVEFYHEYLKQYLNRDVLFQKPTTNAEALPTVSATRSVVRVKGEYDAFPCLCTETGADQITALCNNVPTGNVLLDHTDKYGGLNFVTTKWIDWRSATLHDHRAGTESLPQFPLTTEGIAPRCLGFIYVTWTKLYDLSKQWKRVKLHVLDCTFQRQEYSQQFNFIINPANLGRTNMIELTSSQKRIITGHLNPTVFRSSSPYTLSLGSVWKASRKKKVKDPTEEDAFWDEMNRRELWDRNFDKRHLPFTSLKSLSIDEEVRLSDLTEERRVENMRRLTWDTQNVRLQPT